MTLAASNFIKGLKTLLGGKQCEQLSGFARQRPRDPARLGFKP